MAQWVVIFFSFLFGHTRESPEVQVKKQCKSLSCRSSSHCEHTGLLFGLYGGHLQAVAHAQDKTGSISQEELDPWVLIAYRPLTTYSWCQWSLPCMAPVIFFPHHQYLSLWCFLPTRTCTILLGSYSLGSKVYYSWLSLWYKKIVHHNMELSQGIYIYMIHILNINNLVWTIEV